VDGVQVAWNNNQTLLQILGNIAIVTGNQVTASFATGSQTVTLLSTNPPQPIQITDSIGNFTVLTGLNQSTPVGSLTSGLLGQISSNLSSQQLVQSQAQDSLTQLTNAQADLSAVAFTSGDHGTPVQTEQENAIKSLIAFNAQLQVLQIINQMFADLVGIVGPPTAPATTFQLRG